MCNALCRLLTGLTFLLMATGIPALAALTEVGPVIAPGGYPQYYGDANALRLQLCQDGNGVNGLCIFDPVNPANPESATLGVGDESFWWMATAFINGQGLDAEVVLALEGAFGGIGVAKDGNQIAFGRIRIRVDTPVPGTYTVTHPYGVEVFENVPAGTRAINYTKDIGAINVLAPAAGFAGALRAQIGPFLTWPNYENEPSLLVNGSRYVGNPQVPHVVTGSVFTEPGEAAPANYFRIRGPQGSGIDIRSNLFEVMGKVLPEPPPAANLHVFPPPPPPNLFAVGPVNRRAPFVTPTNGTLTGFDAPESPVGFPLWYQENAGTQQSPAGGLKLAVCPPGDAMCISAPIEPLDPASAALRVGPEAFWWSAEAFINADTADVQNLPDNFDAQLTLAIEAAFGGPGTVNDGDQVAFGRVRIRVDTPVSGTYTITHPYGVEVIQNVTAADGIFFTRDLGVIDPLDPDGSFVGALFSNIGPKFLTWPGYQNEPSLLVNGSRYVGDPAVAHTVTGSSFVPPGEFEPANYFRVQGPEGSGIDVTTELFAVTGKVFQPAAVPFRVCTFRNDRWFFDNGNGVWQPGIDIVKVYGRVGDLPVVGDWNRDGITKIGVVRPNINNRLAWTLDANGDRSRTGDPSFIYGVTGDKPVTGDWNGDGITDVGFVRGNQWFLDANGDHLRNAGDAVFRFGTTTDLPVTGDWNGDGITEVGVFRNGLWILDDGDRVRNPADTIYPAFGQAGDKPVIGDWDGDNRDQLGFFRGGLWVFDNGNGLLEPGTDAEYPQFRLAGDTPFVCGDTGGGQGFAPILVLPAPE